MKDIERKKKLVKFVFVAASSLLIGQLIKLERKMEEQIEKRIDDHFEEPEAPQND